MWPFTKKLIAGDDCFCRFLEEEEKAWAYHSENLCHLESAEECKRKNCNCNSKPSLAKK